MQPKTYLGNFDSRKAHKKMVNSHASNKRSWKNEGNITESHDPEKSPSLKNSGKLEGIDSKSNNQKRSSFLKKKDWRRVIGKVSDGNHKKSKGVSRSHQGLNLIAQDWKKASFSKTDDLNYLKDVEKEADKIRNQRRGTSANTQDPNSFTNSRNIMNIGQLKNKEKKDPLTFIYNNKEKYSQKTQSGTDVGGRRRRDSQGDPYRNVTKSGGVSNSLVFGMEGKTKDASKIWESGKRNLQKNNQKIKNHRDKVAGLKYLKHKYIPNNNRVSVLLLVLSIIIIMLIYRMISRPNRILVHIRRILSTVMRNPLQRKSS